MKKFIPVCEPALNGNEIKYVTDAIKTGWISSAGKNVTEFENNFAKYSDCKYGVSVCNGTVALHLAMVSLGIGKGDEVIIPTFTMIASALSVSYTGATPVFVDADKDTWNIDVSKIEEKITNKTKAIMPVHIFGKMCNMDKIISLASKYNLHIVEDAAEAHGATYKGKKAGSFSSISSFSLFANKNLTTGEGGMVITNNKEIYDKARYYKNMCFSLDGPRNYTHNEIGFNYRMSNLVAAVGVAQVEKADDYRSARIKNNSIYRSFLKDIPGIIFQKTSQDGIDVHWVNAILIDSELYGRSMHELVTYLNENLIGTRLLFNGMHNQNCLKTNTSDLKSKYPVSDWLTNNGFYLPSGSNLTFDQIKFICDLIIKFRDI